MQTGVAATPFVNKRHSLAFVVVAMAVAMLLPQHRVHAQGMYESDSAFERRMHSQIRRLERKVDDAIEELGVGHPNITTRLSGLKQRCAYQKEFLRRIRMTAGGSETDRLYARQALEEDIRMVERELRKIEKDSTKLDEKDIAEEQERLDREALEEEIMQEEW